jgi:hypothetical protein
MDHSYAHILAQMSKNKSISVGKSRIIFVRRDIPLHACMFLPSFSSAERRNDAGGSRFGRLQGDKVPPAEIVCGKMAEAPAVTASWHAACIPSWSEGLFDCKVVGSLDAHHL